VLVDRRVLVKIEAPREFAFDLLVSDRTTRRTSEDDIVSQEPVSEGPIGVGYQMRSKTLHQGKTCLTLTTCRGMSHPLYWKRRYGIAVACRGAASIFVGDMSFTTSAAKHS
jgi:hypothetical protein